MAEATLRPKAVTLVMRVKTEDGWRRYPAAIGPTGKVIKNTIVVEGDHRLHPEGVYEVRTYVGRANQFKKVVPNNPLSARKALDKAISVARLRAQAEENGIVLPEHL